MILHAKPHFLLLSRVETAEMRFQTRGRWEFVLESLEGGDSIEASGEEVFDGERLHLMSILRGLEALDQPSRVTLLTSSFEIQRGFRFGLDSWRGNEWKWERFGRLKTINNADLWQRVDHTLQYHDVHCRVWRVDAAHVEPSAKSAAGANRVTNFFRGPSRPTQPFQSHFSAGSMGRNFA